MGGTRLVIDFAGERHMVEPGGVFTFGRSADLVVDHENLYLHRAVGRFISHGDLWWVENLGSQVELEVESETGVRARLAPPSPDGGPVVAPLLGAHSAVRFTAGGLPYEIAVFHGGLPALGHDLPETLGRETSQFGMVELTPDERALLVALAEPWLRDPAAGGNGRMPTNREVADQLGWPLTKLNRKLDYLCVRLSRAGVRGLQGGRGAEAVNRRTRLVEHAVMSRLITPQDLVS